MHEQAMTNSWAGWRAWAPAARFCSALAAAGLLAGGCAVNPVSGTPELTLVSTEQEKEIGRTARPPRDPP